MKALGFHSNRNRKYTTPGINYVFLVNVSMHNVDYKQENAVELDQIKQSSNVTITTEHGTRGEVIFRLSP